MAWTSPATWITAAVLTAAQLNTQLRDNLIYLKQIQDGTIANGIPSGALPIEVGRAGAQPRAQLVSNSTTLSIPTGTGTATQGRYDYLAPRVLSGMTLLNGSSWTYGVQVDMAGTYLIGASFECAANATGIRLLDIYCGANRIAYGGDTPTASNNTTFSAVGMAAAAVNDAIYINVYQTSGATLTGKTTLWALRIGS